MNFKKHLPTIVRILAIAIIVVGFSTNTAHAISNPFDLIGGSLLSIVNGFLGGLVYFALMTAGWILSLSGTLLNVGMYLTTHLDMFIEKATVIYTVWAIIRDLSSLILIFFILYAAIRMIIGVEDANFGNLIKNIIIVGVLINFSFFFTRVAIDASNIVSLQFYNAIAPNAVNIDNVTDIYGMVKVLTDKGGVSDSLMGSLQITQWWKGNALLGIGNTTTADAFGSTVNIILTAVGGIIVITIATISFLVAAMAAVVRTAVLIFLLAFSPLWIISWALPQLKDLTSKWTSQLKAQLLFMPVYLGFLYVALRIVTESHLNQLTTGSGGDPQGLGNVINLFVGFIIVIVLLNIPFFAAVQVAGAGMGWTDKMFKGMSKNVIGWAGTHTFGRAGLAADKYLAKTWAGNLSLGRGIRSGTTGYLAKSKMGSGNSYEAREKEHADVVRRAAAISRLKDLKRLIAAGETDPDKYGAVMGPMTPKEKLELSADIWKNKEFLKQIDDSDYQAYRKSERVEDTDVVKEQVKQIRREALRDAVAKSQTKVIKHMLEEMNGKELMKQVDNTTGKSKLAKPGVGILVDPEFVEHLTAAHLKSMEDEGLDTTIKKQIGDIIRNQTPPHRAVGYVRKNHLSWGP